MNTIDEISTSLAILVDVMLSFTVEGWDLINREFIIRMIRMVIWMIIRVTSWIREILSTRYLSEPGNNT